MDIHLLLIKITQISILLPVLAGVFVYKKCPLSFKLLVWFYVFSAAIAIFSNLYLSWYKNNLPLLHLFTIVEICTYFVVNAILFQSLNVIRKAAKIGIGFVLFCAIMDVYFGQGVSAFNAVTSRVGALLLFFLTMVQLNILFKKTHDNNFLHQPYFWLLVGVLLYSSTSFFFSILLKQSIAYNPEIFKLTILIYSSMNIIYNCIFAYSFLCHRNSIR